jgi:hypothetical protein
MAKRKTAPVKPKRPTHRDENQSAFDMVQRIIERDERATKSPPKKSVK